MTWKTWTVLAFALILGSTGIEAQRPQPPAQGRSGFQTLAGATARAFRVPADMRLVAQERLGSGAQITAERYRQFLGDACIRRRMRDEDRVARSIVSFHEGGVYPCIPGYIP